MVTTLQRLISASEYQTALARASILIEKDKTPEEKSEFVALCESIELYEDVYYPITDAEKIRAAELKLTNGLA